jgi:putative phosphotransacetylase
MSLDERIIIKQIANKIRYYLAGSGNSLAIPVGISAKHIHLSRTDLDSLFGIGYQLQPFKMLSQPGQFAAKETVTIAGPKGSLAKVRVLGPERSQSQVELSQTDSFALGVFPPVRESGDLQGAADVCVIGPKGSVILREKAIVAKRHIHMTPQDAQKLGLTNGQEASVLTQGSRPLEFGNVVIRVSSGFSLELHIDTDEANASGLCQGDTVYLSGLL